jgi:hypothetical protein
MAFYYGLASGGGQQFDRSGLLERRHEVLQEAYVFRLDDQYHCVSTIQDGLAVDLQTKPCRILPIEVPQQHLPHLGISRRAVLG